MFPPQKMMASSTEKMLSVEELKAEMFKSLRDSGTVDTIRVKSTSCSFNDISFIY
jgi:hypothetical protein